MEANGRNGGNTDERLTMEELGQLTRDIVLGHPTSVVLDNPTKLRIVESLCADIARAKKQGSMIEAPAELPKSSGAAIKWS
jgi:hypothetical protein